MQALIVEFLIKPAYAGAFAAAIAENARASLQTESGCRQFDICRDPADERLFFLYELYDDDAAIRVHLQTPHFLQMNEATAAWVERKTVRQMQRTSP